MKICVLQPDYSTTDVDYKNYDPVRSITQWLPNHQVEYVQLNKLTTYKQLQGLRRQQYDIFINLCEAYLEWEIPSIDVIQSLELLNLPYTGATLSLYDPPKPLMKYVAYSAGVTTPKYIVCTSTNSLSVTHLTFPLFVKPAKAGDSLGIDLHSKCNTVNELTQKVNTLLEQYDELLIEEYIAGREFTVLVVADTTTTHGCYAYNPVEYIFDEHNHFKTYDHKTKDLHPDRNVPINDDAINQQLKDAACAVFKAFEGKGYARMDFRMDANGVIYFLEVNFACSVFYTNGYEGSADYILLNTPNGHEDFLQRIIAEGIARHTRKQKLYHIGRNATDGYGIYATQHIPKGTVIFAGEESMHRLVSHNYVQQHWDGSRQLDFARYAVPISSDVYLIWDIEPANWAPQNHSCSPNTCYNGLQVIALSDIPLGEELTLDYQTIINTTMQPFQCCCGATNCRSVITGKAGTTLTQQQ